MRSEVGEAELDYGYPRFPISTSAPRLSYLAPKHVQRKLSAVAVYFKKGRLKNGQVDSGTCKIQKWCPGFQLVYYA